MHHGYSIYKRLNGDTLDYYVLLCDLVDEIRDDIDSIDKYFFENSRLDDSKLKAIYHHLEQEFPSMGTLYFIPLLLAESDTSYRFMSSHEDIKGIEYKSFYKDIVISVNTDTYIVNYIDKIESILDPEENVWCCEKHKEMVGLDIVNCTEEDSFNQSFSLGNMRLSDFIEC